MNGRKLLGLVLGLIGVVLFVIAAFIAISATVNVVALGLAFGFAGVLLLLIP